MRSGFSNIHWTIEESIAENDKVAIRYTMRGTHDGIFLGIHSTGKKIEVQSIAFYQLADNQIIEEKGQPDMLGILQQIGAFPKI